MAVLHRAPVHGECDSCLEPIVPGDPIYTPDEAEPFVMVCEVCVEEDGL